MREFNTKPVELTHTFIFLFSLLAYRAYVQAIKSYSHPCAHHIII